MSSLRLWIKVNLFFSSYTPLFLILLLQHFAQNGFELIPQAISIDYIFSLLLIFSIIFSNIIILLVIRNRIKAGNPKKITIAEREDINYYYMAYLFSYVIPFLSLNYNNLWNLVSLLILLMIVLILYVNTNLLYVNIMFNFFGFNLLKIRDQRDNDYILISKRKKFLKNELINVKSVSDNFVIDIGGGSDE
jgi:hypothetical protein